MTAIINITYENKYHIRKTWYFLKEGHAIKPSEKVLNTVFPGHEAEIDKYLYTVQMDYQSKEDLLTLIDYCSKL